MPKSPKTPKASIESTDKASAKSTLKPSSTSNLGAQESPKAAKTSTDLTPKPTWFNSNNVISSASHLGTSESLRTPKASTKSKAKPSQLNLLLAIHSVWTNFIDTTTTTFDFTMTPFEKFCISCIKGDEMEVSMWLRVHPDILNMQYKDASGLSKLLIGTTALHIASICDQKKIASLILDQNPELNCMKDKQLGFTALHLASHEGYKEMVTLLIEHNPDIATIPDEKGRTALHFAAEKGHKEVAEVLLKKNPDLLRIKTAAGLTAKDIGEETNTKESRQVASRLAVLEFEQIFAFSQLKSDACSIIRLINYAIYFFVQIPSHLCTSMEKPCTGILESYNSKVVELLHLSFGKWCPCFGPTKLYALLAETSTTLQHGQYWKLITNTFLHGGLFHLFSNMVALAMYGNSLVNLVGNFKFLVIYFLSGLVASCASSYNLPSDKILLGASGAIYGIMAADEVIRNGRIEGGQNLVSGWILCELATEGVLAYTALNATKYDEVLQLIALFAIKIILSRRFPNNKEFQKKMRGTIKRFLIHLLFNDNIGHTAHFIGGLTGFVLASGIFINKLPQFDGDVLVVKDKVKINGVKNYTEGEIIASKLEDDNNVLYMVHVLAREGKKDCSKENIKKEIRRDNLTFINPEKRVKSGAASWAMVILVIAVFTGLCWQAFSEDLLAEKLFENIDVFDGFESTCSWFDLGETLGVADGAGTKHPIYWTRVNQRN